MGSCPCLVAAEPHKAVCFVGSLFLVFVVTYPTLHLGPLLQTSVTEDPTTKIPSSVFWRSGHGMRYWRARDPGRRREKIAGLRRKWKQQKRNGEDTRRRLAESGYRPEPSPRAYRGERGTGQAPCYAVKRTVSPVSARTDCAGSALLASGASSVQDILRRLCVSGAAPQPSTSCASASQLPG